MFGERNHRREAMRSRLLKLVSIDLGLRQFGVNLIKPEGFNMKFIGRFHIVQGGFIKIALSDNHPFQAHWICHV